MRELEIIDNLHEFIAPQIMENELVKEILTLQMFTNPNVGECMHLLLVGEASTGKSDMCIDLTKILPRASYAASNITKIGLLEKLIACDRGYIMIDEFDKLSNDVRNALLEAMEAQTVTVDKFGHHYRLDARVNVTVCANPKDYKFQENMPLLAQLPYSLPLLSRFHLIIPFKPLSPERYPEAALRHNKLRDNSEERRDKIREYVMEVKDKIPLVDVSDKFALETGKFIKRLKDLSPLRDMVTIRLIKGFLIMLKSQARLNLRDHATIEDFTKVKRIFERFY